MRLLSIVVLVALPITALPVTLSSVTQESAERWSTAAERNQLVAAMQKGQPELLKVLRDTKALNMNATGEGKGTLSLATRVLVDDDNAVEFERYTVQPIQLNEVKRVD